MGEPLAKEEPTLNRLANLTSLVRPEIPFAEAAQHVKDLLFQEVVAPMHQLRFEGFPQVDLERNCDFITDVNGSLLLMLERTSELISSEQPTASEVRNSKVSSVTECSKV